MTRVPRLCTVDGCGRKHSAKGYCGPHRNAEKRGLDPAAYYIRPKVLPPEERAANRARTKREWMDRNREQWNANRLAWYYENKEIHAKRTRARRARIAGVESEPYDYEAILLRWGTDCHLCGEEIDLKAPRCSRDGGNWKRGLHLDHVVPLSRGGADIIDNVKPSHAECNLRKYTAIDMPVDTALLCSDGT